MSSYIGQSPVFGDFPSQILFGDGTATYELNFKVSNENGMLVFLNGAVQRPGQDYTAGGTSLAFADTIAVGVQILAIGMGLPKSMLSTSAGAIGLAELAAGVYASAAEAQGFTNNTKLITPKTLDDSFKGANQNLTQAGYQKYPGGLIEQWGSVLVGTGGLTPVTLPIAFPSMGLSAQGTIAQTNFVGANGPGVGVEFTSNSQISIRNAYSGSPLLIWYRVIGM